MVDKEFLVATESAFITMNMSAVYIRPNAKTMPSSAQTICQRLAETPFATLPIDIHGC
jgi:hypothetical protein